MSVADAEPPIAVAVPAMASSSQTHRRPTAEAIIRGGSLAPNIRGELQFYPLNGGTLIRGRFEGFPRRIGNRQVGPHFAMHIHEGRSCGNRSGNNPFSAAGAHFNPTRTRHPHHLGDIPMLTVHDGRATYAHFDSRFTPEQVIGRTVVIRRDEDDFITQSSGNPGPRIACGPITAVFRHR